MWDYNQQTATEMMSGQEYLVLNDFFGVEVYVHVRNKSMFARNNFY